jgi:hypothetical protein
MKNMDHVSEQTVRNIKAMTLEQARETYEMWRDSFHTESRDPVPDEDYLAYCDEISGVLGAHIQILEEVE